MSNVAEIRSQLHLVLEKLRGQAERIMGAIAALEEIEASEISAPAPATAKTARADKKAPKATVKPTAKAAKKGASKSAKAKTKPAPSPKPGARKTSENALPSTGGDFWPSLITATPQSPAEILQAAIEKIGHPLDAAMLKKLKDRQSFALNNMTNKTKQIASSGAGTTRTYHLP